MVTHLSKILLRDPSSPFDAQVQGPARVGHVSTLDHHALDKDLVFRKVLPSRVAFTIAAFTLEETIRPGLVTPTEANSAGTQVCLELSKWELFDSYVHI